MADARSRIAIQRRGNIVNVKNPSLQVTYDLRSGTWGYQDKSGYHVIRNAYAGIELSDGKKLTTRDAVRSSFSAKHIEDDEDGAFIQVRFTHQYRTENYSFLLNIFVNVYEESNHLLVRASVSPQEGNVHVKRVDIITVSPIGETSVGAIFLGSAPTNYKIYLNTHSDHPSTVRPILDGVDITGVNEIYHNGVIYSSETKRSISFGFLEFKKWWGSIDVEFNSQLQPLKNYKGVNRWSMYQIWDRPLMEETSSEAVYINYVDHYRSAQRDYAERVASRAGLTEIAKPVVRWNSRPRSGDVSEKWILDNINWIKNHPGGSDSGSTLIDYVEIPQGWQRWYGVSDYSRERFPNGMKAIADAIHASGMKAAIYFSPYEIDETWPEAPRMKDAYLRNADGEPERKHYGERSVIMLDPSNPMALEFTARQVGVIKDWGFDALLLDIGGYVDYLDIGFNPNYHDKTLSRIELYRSGIENIVRAAAPMLVMPRYGCTSYNIGLATVNSISVDTWRNPFEVRWEDRYGISEMVKLWSSKLYSQGILWRHSLDAVSIVEPRPLNEVIILLTACALSGSMVSLVGSLVDLKDERIDMLSKIIPLQPTPAVPVDLMESDYPGIWHLRQSTPFGESDLIGVFNWEDFPSDISINMTDLGLSDSESYVVHEFWTREFLGDFQKSIDLYNVPPRSVLLLNVMRSLDHPQIIATDIHFSQGATEIITAGWDERSSTLLASLRAYREMEGSVFIHVPGDYLPSSVSAFGSEYGYEWSPPTLTVRFSSLRQPNTMAVRFSKSRG